MLQHLEELLIESEELLLLDLPDAAGLNSLLSSSNPGDLDFQLVLHDGGVGFCKQRAVLPQSQSFHHPHPFLPDIPTHNYPDHALALPKPEGLLQLQQQGITGLGRSVQKVPVVLAIGIRMERPKRIGVCLYVEV